MSHSALLPQPLLYQVQYHRLLNSALLLGKFFYKLLKYLVTWLKKRILFITSGKILVLGEIMVNCCQVDEIS
jgi:hypothetical protein